MRYKQIFTILPLLMVIAGDASAADFSVLGTIPGMFTMLILLCALASLAVAIKLFSLVKGGALAKGYQLWVISFITLAVSQILILLEKMGIFALTFDVATVLFAGTVILWLIGLMQARKVLG